MISRIRRDFERKQEFLRTTNLPNYLGSPTGSTHHSQQTASAASVHHQQAQQQRTVVSEAVESDTEFYVKTQQLQQPQRPQQHQQQSPIVQPEADSRGGSDRGRLPVYFADRFPVQSSNQPQPHSSRAIDDQADQSQFHLYGLQLGKIFLKIFYFKS